MLGVDPYALSQEWTERQLILFLKWLREKETTPSLPEYYLMQIACEIRRILNFLLHYFGRSKQSDVSVKDFRLEFKDPTITTEEAKPKGRSAQQIAMDKAILFARLGKRPKNYNPPRLLDADEPVIVDTDKRDE